MYTKGLVDVGSIEEAYDYFHAKYHAVSRLREKIAGWIVMLLAMDPEEGCPEARKLLKQRYGQSYKITTA